MNGSKTEPLRNSNCDTEDVYRSDWLASYPIFYNIKTGSIDSNINNVIDFRNLEFDAEGLNNYLEFGYSVFEHTPVKDVKFLRHSSVLTKGQTNQLSIQYLEDPTPNLLAQQSKEQDVWDRLSTSIKNWEQSSDGHIVIPTSGGYDSRILNSLITDKSRIKSFTYGISTRQNESYEVIYAKALAERLKTSWKQITLGNFHQYFDKWNDLYGVSTHAHGMYQMEFYEKILVELKTPANLLSGIIGDAWAGSVWIDPVSHANEVVTLGYSHNLKAGADYSLLRSNGEYREKYFEENRKKLEDPKFRVIESMRFKIILLSYLLKVPTSLGFKAWSPFLDQTNALSMLNLPAERRASRRWQVDYFERHSIHLESLGIKVDRTNSLDRIVTKNYPPSPLDISILEEIIKREHIHRINRTLTNIGLFSATLSNLIQVPKVGGVLKRLGYSDPIMRDYNAYLTLKPLEFLIKKRNLA